MKTLLAVALVFFAAISAKAANYTGIYAGDYRYITERIVVDGKTYNTFGTNYSGLKVKARVFSEGRLKIVTRGWLKLNGAATGVYVDEVYYGRVNDEGRIRLGSGGIISDFPEETYGAFTILSKEARIRNGRMVLKSKVESSKLGLVLHDMVAYKL